MLTTETLRQHLVTNVPVFRNIEILQAGEAFHYTPHFSEILKTGKFFGAPVDQNLDFTQDGFDFPKATCDPGVVFAYEHSKDAVEEGAGCDVLQIEYSSAIRAEHSQEVDCMGAPPTILIVNADILGFEFYCKGRKSAFHFPANDGN